MKEPKSPFSPAGNPAHTGFLRGVKETIEANKEEWDRMVKELKTKTTKTED